MKPKILLADDHSIIRNGLKLYVQFNLGHTDVAEVSTCNGLMNELVKNKYTHLVLDIILSDGSTLEVIPNIKRLYPNLQIMIFSMQPTEVYGAALKQYGINYYLSKTCGEDEILQMLHQFISNEDIPLQHSAVVKDNPFSALAPRELEILHYVLKGIGTKDIADNLNLKMNTISTIKNRIYEKTNAGNIKELMELATLYSVNY
jgi:two-component system, NarL family, invasion response regulator UvrY